MRFSFLFIVFISFFRNEDVQTAETSTPATNDQFPVIEDNENLNFEVKNFKFGSSKFETTRPKMLSPSSVSEKEKMVDTPSVRRTSSQRSPKAIPARVSSRNQGTTSRSDAPKQSRPVSTRVNSRRRRPTQILEESTPQAQVKPVTNSRQSSRRRQQAPQIQQTTKKPELVNSRQTSRTSSRQSSRARINNQSVIQPTTASPVVTVTPSAKFAAPLSNDVLSSLHQTSHKPMFPVPDYGRDELRFKGSDVLITEIGTIEDTDPSEVQLILSGLGGRRRGLARPPSKSPKTTKPISTTTTTTPSPDYDYFYDPLVEYEYVYEYVYEDELPTTV